MWIEFRRPAVLLLLPLVHLYEMREICVTNIRPNFNLVNTQKEGYPYVPKTPTAPDARNRRQRRISNRGQRESRYRANLDQLFGAENDGDGVDLVRTAYMVVERSNPNDRNALRVDIGQLTVGYLPRDLAAVLSPALVANGLVAIQTAAHVTAGFEGGHYSVWLAGDLAEIMASMTAMQAARPRRRRVPWWVWALLLLLASGCGCLALSGGAPQ
jgi:hypothetical protein